MEVRFFKSCTLAASGTSESLLTQTTGLEVLVPGSRLSATILPLLCPMLPPGGVYRLYPTRSATQSLVAWDLASVALLVMCDRLVSRRYVGSSFGGLPSAGPGSGGPGISGACLSPPTTQPLLRLFRCPAAIHPSARCRGSSSNLRLSRGRSPSSRPPLYPGRTGTSPICAPQ